MISFFLYVIVTCFLVSVKEVAASAKPPDIKKLEFSSLADISFDTSREQPENDEVYVILVEGQRRERPQFSILRESELHHDESGDVLVRAVWQDRMDETGWNHLHVAIDEDARASDNHKSYAAGVLEGFLTRRRIRDFFLNTREMIFSQPGGRAAVKPVQEIFRDSIKRVKEKTGWDDERPLLSKDAPDVVDQLVRLAVLQIWGISDGYEAVRKHFHPNETWHEWPAIDVVNMHFLSADGDIPDIKDAVIPAAGQSFKDGAYASSVKSHSFTTTVRAQGRLYGRCSALVRLADDNSDLFVGHSTWEPFSEMTRIIKYYDFPFKGVAAKRLAFPSYPGAITSTDDFIISSRGLLLTETTIDIKNRALFRQRSNLEKGPRYSDFMKPLVAARLAGCGQDWIDVFERYANSFLNIASCQWMVVDYNKFHRGEEPKDSKLFYLVEQIPGLMKYEDLTNRLKERGYWGSSNRSWFRKIRDVLGDEISLDNDTSILSVFSRNENPRAFTFKHLAPRANSLSVMRRLMQFSPSPKKGEDFLKNLAIAPRFDMSAKQTPEGATDSKIIDSSLMKELSFIAISGPQHEQDEPFSWIDDRDRNKFDANLWPHLGMPDTWNFTWYYVDDGGLTELRRTRSSQARLDQMDEWSEELQEALRRRNDRDGETGEE